MIIAGVVFTLIGLVGLIYCIIKANQARKAGLEGEALVAKLQGLVAINMAAVGFSGIGLALVVVGILL
ncbi:MAG: hypothetical protein AAF429_04570 [Pseudomonadota bacterium]